MPLLGTAKSRFSVAPSRHCVLLIDRIPYTFQESLYSSKTGGSLLVPGLFRFCRRDGLQNKHIRAEGAPEFWRDPACGRSSKSEGKCGNYCVDATNLLDKAHKHNWIPV